MIRMENSLKKLGRGKLAAVLQTIKKWGRRHAYLLLLALPFLAMEVGIKIIGRNINYYRQAMVFPNILFIFIWTGLIVGVTSCLAGRAAKIFYNVVFAVLFAMYIVHGAYYEITNYFFGFSLLESASEGSSYILDAILALKPWFYVTLAVVLFLFFFAKAHTPGWRAKQGKTCWRGLLLLPAVFVILHLVTPLFYGAANEELEWDTWRNPRNVYENFNDSNKCMLICGLMEYTVRDFYVTYLRPAEAEDEEELAILEEAYSTATNHEENALTGIFEGKNVIFLQLEGMDSWLITEEDTPNLYALMNNSIVFENHYSYFTGGGSTFNSELAVNTGFITPVSYTKNPYSFTTNSFPYSLARMFGALGYAVNCFHMNTEEYYQRGINYKNWGYDHYYSLLDENDYSDLSYELDRELILDEKFYDRLFTQYAVTVADTEDGAAGTDTGTADTDTGTEDGTADMEDGTADMGNGAAGIGTSTDSETGDTEEGSELFAHYIITYTPHTPFVTDRGVGKYLAELIYGDEVPEMDEEAVARMMAGETDYMVGLLMQALKDNGLYENTVIVAYADHYLYTLNDEAILEKYKTTDNNLINQTPFFLWSSDMAQIAEELLEEASGESSGEADVDQEEESSSEAESGFTGSAGGTILNGQGTVKLLADGSVSIRISKVNSQIDILPTVLNLFGIDYEDEYYVGSDIFEENYSGYVFFSDYSWYDGTVYASGSDDYQILTWQAPLDTDVLEADVLSMFSKISDLIRKNDLTLKYDYLRQVYGNK